MRCPRTAHSSALSTENTATSPTLPLQVPTCDTLGPTASSTLQIPHLLHFSRTSSKLPHDAQAQVIAPLAEHTCLVVTCCQRTHRRASLDVDQLDSVPMPTLTDIRDASADVVGAWVIDREVCDVFPKDDKTRKEPISGSNSGVVAVSKSYLMPRDAPRCSWLPLSGGTCSPRQAHCNLLMVH